MLSLLYIVPHCLQNSPLLQPENNHRPVNFPLLQHFPETRNVSQGNKPENANISRLFSYSKAAQKTKWSQKESKHFLVDTKTRYKRNQGLHKYKKRQMKSLWPLIYNV